MVVKRASSSSSVMMRGGEKARGVSGVAEHGSLALVFKAGAGGLQAASARCAFAGGEFYRAHEADVADVYHVGAVAQGVELLFKGGGEGGGAGEEVLALVDGEGRVESGGGDRVGGVGRAVEEFYQVARAVGVFGDRFKDAAAADGCAHGDGAVGQALGAGDDVWDDAGRGGVKGCAETPPSGDDFVKDEEDAVAWSLFGAGAPSSRRAGGGHR